MLNSTLKFVHKLLRDFLLECSAIPCDVARFCWSQLSSCSQNWFAEQLALILFVCLDTEARSGLGQVSRSGANSSHRGGGSLALGKSYHQP